MPQEERHDVTSLYHRMDLVELQERFSLKVRPRHPPTGPAPTLLGTHSPHSYSCLKGTVWQHPGR